ncbi:MAG: hypothetical protein ACU84Q_05895 [Gammaproteobacteria bacterium]
MSKDSAADTGNGVPRWVWLWSLPLPFVIHLLAGALDQDRVFFDRWIESELGFIENLTVLVLVPATLLFLHTAVRFWRCTRTGVALWFALAALVCVGFGGEEASWGQHWFGWESPDYFEENNRQGETNFHNLDIQVGRTVKAILTLGIIIGGLILPLARKPAEAVASGSFIDAVLGTRSCVPAAFWVFFVRLIERLKTWFDIEWMILAVNLKELQELYIALFLFVYAWAMKKRSEKISQ